MQWIKTKGLWVVFMLLAVCMNVFSGSHHKPLTPDQAFVLSVKVNQANKVTAEWQIAPGYYLYRQRLHFSLTPHTNAEILFPQSELKYDSNRTSNEVYKGKLSIPIVLQTSLFTQPIELNIDYQGCSENGFCYPPMHKSLKLTGQTLSNASQEGPQLVEMSTSPILFFSLLTDHQGVRNLFLTQHYMVMLLVFAGLGLLLAFTPCVLPMIPILTSIIVGQQQGMTTSKAFFLSLTYVLGSSIIYAIAGMMAALMGHSLQVWLQQTWVMMLVSGLFVLLAFSLFGWYDLSLPRYWQNRLSVLTNKQKKGTYWGVFIMGMISALIVSPCVTAPLVGVLMYIAQTGHVLLGASALFVMGMGMGLPLLLVGISAGKLLPKRGPWMEIMKKFFGLLMLGMAVWLLARVATPATMMIFTGVLLLALALYSMISSHPFQRYSWVSPLGYAMIVLSVFFMVGGMIKPNVFNQWISSPQESSNVFMTVHNINELKKQLTAAQVTNRPVILDFYADWCESCITMDKKVFNVPAVRQALKNFVLLRADLTANNSADETLLKYYDVVAPPTVLFFNRQGREVNSHRIIGEVNEKEFTMRLNQFISASCDIKLQC